MPEAETPELEGRQAVEETPPELEGVLVDEREFASIGQQIGGAISNRCPPDTVSGGNPRAQYNLPGLQVEPEAAFWLTPAAGSSAAPYPLPRVPTLAEIQALTIGTGAKFPVAPYPTDPAVLNREIEELKELAKLRDDPRRIASNEAGRERLPLSDFILLRPPPFGAIFNICNSNPPSSPYCDREQTGIRNVNQQNRRRNDPRLRDVVKTGRELARMFEIETPGLAHRQALNLLFYNRPDISPPRQARVWMAFEVTLYAALSAAWWFKWAADPKFSFRQRPYEYDRGANFRVLYDSPVGDLGRFDSPPRTCPCPSPGTPRHPAYPSGHSTYSAAASAILTYFFPDEEKHFTQLADNIGMARLWAGVHWRSDHVAGVQIGNAVAHAVIQQLQDDCISPLPQAVPPCNSTDMPAKPTGRPNRPCDPTQDRIPPRPNDPAFVTTRGTF